MHFSGNSEVERWFTLYLDPWHPARRANNTLKLAANIKLLDYICETQVQNPAPISPHVSTFS